MTQRSKWFDYIMGISSVLMLVFSSCVSAARPWELSIPSAVEGEEPSRVTLGVVDDGGGSYHLVLPEGSEATIAGTGLEGIDAVRVTVEEVEPGDNNRIRIAAVQDEASAELSSQIWTRFNPPAIGGVLEAAGCVVSYPFLYIDYLTLVFVPEQYTEAEITVVHNESGVYWGITFSDPDDNRRSTEVRYPQSRGGVITVKNATFGGVVFDATRQLESVEHENAVTSDPESASETEDKVDDNKSSPENTDEMKKADADKDQDTEDSPEQTNTLAEVDAVDTDNVTDNVRAVVQTASPAPFNGSVGGDDVVDTSPEDIGILEARAAASSGK